MTADLVSTVTGEVALDDAPYLSPTTVAVLASGGSYPAWIAQQRTSVTVLLAALPLAAAVGFAAMEQAALTAAAAAVLAVSMLARCLRLHRQARFSGWLAEQAIGANEELEDVLCDPCLAAMSDRTRSTSRDGSRASAAGRSAT